jgi:hypothetical protein
MALEDSNLSGHTLGGDRPEKPQPAAKAPETAPVASQPQNKDPQ